MSRVYQRGRAEVAANITPMIDVTFLLIIFFVVVSQIVDVESADLQLPMPHEPLTAAMTDENRVVINIVPAAGDPHAIAEYRVGVNPFQPDARGVEQMIAHLAGLYRQNPNLSVNLRADRATHYEWVEPAMHAVSQAAARAAEQGVRPRVNLVVVRPE